MRAYLGFEFLKLLVLRSAVRFYFLLGFVSRLSHSLGSDYRLDASVSFINIASFFVQFLWIDER